MSLIIDTPGARVWQGEGWELREGRWQDSPPEVVDVVIADPPYDEETHTKRRRGGDADPIVERRRNSPTRSKAGLFGSSAEVSFAPIDPANVGPSLVCLALRWVVLFCAAEQLGGYRSACNGTYIRGGVWTKTDPTPQFSGDRPGQWGDGIAILHRKGRKRWGRGGCAAHYHGPVEHAWKRHGRTEKRLHETQKPLWLMRALVLDFSEPGELVWDPYAGSATTGVACLAEGRRFLGHEMQAGYAEVAAERLQAAEDGFTLREARALKAHGEYQRARRAKQGTLELAED